MKKSTGRETRSAQATLAAGGVARPVVPRRRVAAVVHLSDGSSLSGDLYAAVGGEQAHSEPILERLQDPRERYLPLADGNRHYLVNKSAVKFVELARVENAGEFDPTSAPRSFRVEAMLDSGETLRGVAHSHARETHYRTLDHLNESGRGFLRIVRRPGVVYVNHDHVVAVYDLVER